MKNIVTIIDDYIIENPSCNKKVRVLAFAGSFFDLMNCKSAIINQTKIPFVFLNSAPMIGIDDFDTPSLIGQTVMLCD